MPPRPRTTPRKQPSQERARATVDAILSATARLLVKEGYDRASTNKVALAAGVSIGSLYQYFPSKEALVAALIDRHSGQMMAAFEEQLAEASGLPLREAVPRVARAWVIAHAVDPRLHAVIHEQIPRVGRLSRVEQLEARAEALLSVYLEAHRGEIRPTDIEAASFLLVQLVEAATHKAVSSRGDLLEGDRLSRELSDVILRYLLP